MSTASFVTALFSIAGLWSPWLNPNTGRWEQTFSILTGVSNEVMLQIHAINPEFWSPASTRSILRQPHGFHCIWHAFSQVKR